MTRRDLLHGLSAAPLLAQSAQQPNIVFVLSDDHSVPYLGCYGDPHIKTPNLDRFASQGMRMDRAFTAAPQCVPSRAAYLTGRSPVGARMGRFNSPLPPDVATLPELLREKGYFTGVCRRNFHLDGPGNNLGPSMRKIMNDNAMLTWDRRVDWLDRNSPRAQTKAKLEDFFGKVPEGKPFFLWVNFNDPHHVWDRTGAHDPAKVSVPGNIPDLPGVRDDLSRYYDEIGRMDEEFQWVLDEIEKRGKTQNTLVVFAGDNGMAFPRGKGSLHERGLHVPMIVRWPGRIKPGTSSELVSGEDVTPTLLEAAGVPPLKQMTGKSFLGLLTGRPNYTPREAIFGARLYHGSGPFTEDTKASTFDLSRCVRTKKWKLIYNCTPKMEYQPVDSARDPGWQDILKAHAGGKLKPDHERIYFGKRPVYELYDLDSDPQELTNLSGKPEWAGVEKDLRIKLAEKMVVDYDFLPLPVALNE